MMRGVALWGVVLVLLGSASAEEIQDLDQEIVVHRIRDQHGQLRIEPPTRWEARYEGRTEEWQWGDEQWDCPDEAIINCRNWVPMSFRMWRADANWLWDSEPVEKLGYEVLREPPSATKQSLLPRVSSAFMGGELTSQDEEEEKERLALEVWRWRFPAGGVAEVLLSAQTDQIRQLRFPNDWTEHIEWERPSPRASLRFQRIVVERGNQRVVFSPLYEDG